MRLPLPSIALLALTVTGCGDDLDPPTPPISPDASVTPVVQAVVVTPSASFMPGQPGVLSAVDVGAATTRPNIGPAMAVGNDPVLRKHDDLLYVVNRGTNNVTILDAADFSLVEQLSTGAGSNPQDVAVHGERLFVATYGNKGLVELRRGFPQGTEIDLSMDDPDGKPNCNSLIVVGDQLYVSCELLDDTQMFPPPRGPGKVYVLDANTRAVMRTLTLSTNNPFNLFTRVPEDAAMYGGDLVIGTIDFATGAGCIERITPGPTPVAAGCLISNADLGGYASRIDFSVPEFTGPVNGRIIPTHLMWTVVGRPDFSTMVRSYSLHAAELQPPLPEATAGASPLDLVVCDGYTLVVSDAPLMGAGGLRIVTNQRETTLLPVGLKPASTAGLVCY